MSKENKNERSFMDEFTLTDTDKVYDAVFWTEVNRFSRFLSMLVNEAFGEHFTMNAKVELLPNKQVAESTDDKHVRRDVDMLFILSEYLDGMVRKAYHYEVEVKGTRRIAIRIAQYATAHAFTNVSMLEDGAEIEIPNSAVIFLRSDSADIDKLTIYINYPEGNVSYKVPVMKIKDYTLDELIEKKLVLLIPFYVFTITEKEFAEMEEDISKFSKLEEIVRDINLRLEKLVERNEIDSYEKKNLIRYTYRVLKKLVGNRTRVKEGVEKLMGGEIIVTDVDIMKEKMEELEKNIEEKNNALAEKDAEIVRLKENEKKRADEAEARIRELEAQLAEARKNK